MQRGSAVAMTFSVQESGARWLVCVAQAALYAAFIIDARCYALEALAQRDGQHERMGLRAAY